MLDIRNKAALAYIIGVALGDGNLSNPNGRAVRLRVTCDTRYPNIIKEISEQISLIAPDNKVSLAKKPGNCVDVYCYSNDWEHILGWKVGKKIEQKVSIPIWIKRNRKYARNCLRGLFQTDGSIYRDRGYLMVNFVNCCKSLAFDVQDMIESLGFRPKMSLFQQKKTVKYTVRLARNTKEFIDSIGLYKN